MNKGYFPNNIAAKYWLPLIFPLTLLFGCEKQQSETDVQPRDNTETGHIAPKQVLVRGNYVEPFSLDPHYGGGMDANIIRDLHEGLVAEAPGGGIRPAVASHWEKPDSKTFVFHLRPTAKWSNGEPVTAHDFVYSWRRLVDPATASPHGRYLGDVKVLNAGKINSGELPVEQLGIRAIDDHTLEISLDTNVPYFLHTLVDSATFPIHRQTVLTHGDSWTSAANHVGNGAFNLDSWQVNERIEVVPNPQYWDASKVRLDRVIFLPISSENSELKRYLAGEIDMTASIPPPMYSQLWQEHPKEIVEHPTMETKILVFNNLKPPFNDSKVRRALALAIDRDVIVDKVWQRGDIPAYSLVPTLAGQSPIFTPEWATWTKAEREVEAQQLLSEAGYSTENPLRFTFSYMASSNKKRMAIALASMWGKVLGANVELRDRDARAHYESIMNLEFSITEAGIRAQYNDPISILNNFLSTSEQSIMGFKNPDYDRALLESLNIDNSSARFAHYASAERILSREMPIIPLYYKVAGMLVKPHVAGFEPSAIYHMYSRDLWIESRLYSHDQARN